MNELFDIFWHIIVPMVVLMFPVGAIILRGNLGSNPPFTFVLTMGKTIIKKGLGFLKNWMATCNVNQRTGKNKTTIGTIICQKISDNSFIKLYF